MQACQQEIIILKPTKRFLSFLSAFRSDIEWVDFSLPKEETTAYTFPKHETDDALLNELERRFPQMFQHEIARWLGDEAGSRIKGSFFDFLCFFKFELHTQLVCLQ